MTSTVESARRANLRRLAILLVLVACAFGLVLAVRHTRRGDEEIAVTGGNETVDLLQPTSGQTQVNQQAQVGIDLKFPYLPDSLVIAGTAIPEDQLLVTQREAQGAIYYLPGPGKVLEALPQGNVCAEVSLHNAQQPEKAVAPVRWCFTVV